MVFDLNDTDSEFPVAAPLPMAPFINEKGEEIPQCMYFQFSHLISSDPKHWQFFSPNFILDTQEGYIWDVRLNLHGIHIEFHNNKIKRTFTVFCR